MGWLAKCTAAACGATMSATAYHMTHDAMISGAIGSAAEQGMEHMISKAQSFWQHSHEHHAKSLDNPSSENKTAEAEAAKETEHMATTPDATNRAAGNDKNPAVSHDGSMSHHNAVAEDGVWDDDTDSPTEATQDHREDHDQNESFAQDSDNLEDEDDDFDSAW